MIKQTFHFERRSFTKQISKTSSDERSRHCCKYVIGLIGSYSSCWALTAGAEPDLGFNLKKGRSLSDVASSDWRCDWFTAPRPARCLKILKRWHISAWRRKRISTSLPGSFPEPPSLSLLGSILTFLLLPLTRWPSSSISSLSHPVRTISFNLVFFLPLCFQPSPSPPPFIYPSLTASTSSSEMPELLHKCSMKNKLTATKSGWKNQQQVFRCCWCSSVNIR